jgi:hypothetical protein
MQGSPPISQAKGQSKRFTIYALFPTLQRKLKLRFQLSYFLLRGKNKCLRKSTHDRHGSGVVWGGAHRTGSLVGCFSPSA